MLPSYIIMAVAALLVIFLVLWTWRTGKPRHYKVTMADKPDQTLDLERRWGDGWSDTREMKVYHYPDGKRIILSTHWIIKVEEA